MTMQTLDYKNNNNDGNQEGESLLKIKDSLDWFYSNYDEHKKFHANRYVAIKNRRCIDYDISLDALMRRLNLDGYDESIAIEFVYI